MASSAATFRFKRCAAALALSQLAWAPALAPSSMLIQPANPTSANELKIDRIFVSDMVENPTHDVIVRSIVDLGHNLGLRVVGEGVETHAVLLHLRSAGCDVTQGFLLARPMPLGQLRVWLGGVPVAGVVPAWTDAIATHPLLTGLL